MRKHPAVFLDRDGVINEDDDNYIKSWDEYRFFPGALEALRRLHEAGLEVYLVTNQAGVGKGVFPYRNLQDILLRLRLTAREHGGLIHGIAYCCHRKDEACPCRKPQPGMLRKLAAKYGLDLERSVLVGDSCTDIQAAQAVGCTTIFLHTREAERIAEHLAQCDPPPDYQAASLAEAVNIVIPLLQEQLAKR
ncbi:MAG: HAD family hydrolase [Armatimonadia bacterium]